MDDVDAEIQAVTKMFGEVAPPLSSEQPSPSAIDTKNLLTVEHRQDISVGDNAFRLLRFYVAIDFLMQTMK
jgi:hypothetical protein